MAILRTCKRCAIAIDKSLLDLVAMARVVAMNIRWIVLDLRCLGPSAAMSMRMRSHRVIVPGSILDGDGCADTYQECHGQLPAIVIVKSDFGKDIG